MEFIKNGLKEASDLLSKFSSNDENLEKIHQAANAFAKTLEGGGRILACGNGGSMCDSIHFTEELTGRFRKDRAPLAAISMDNPGHITCVANDFGYEYIFSRQVEAFGKKGDSLLAISTSGNSENVIQAVLSAKNQGMNTIGLLGKDGGKLAGMVDVPIVVPSKVTDRIQEIHIKIIHLFIEGIERNLYPDHY